MIWLLVILLIKWVFLSVLMVLCSFVLFVLSMGLWLVFWLQLVVSVFKESGQVLGIVCCFLIRVLRIWVLSSERMGMELVMKQVFQNRVMMKWKWELVGQVFVVQLGVIKQEGDMGVIGGIKQLMFGECVVGLVVGFGFF